MKKIKRNANRDAVRVLEEYGFIIIQFIEQDDKYFYEDLIVFEADLVGCIRAHQILEKEGFRFSECSLQISIVNGVLEPLHGQIIFHRR